MVIDSLGYKELRIFRPSIVTLGEADLFLTERFTMRGGRSLLVWRAIANMAVQHDKGGAALRLPEVIS
jgi:hypothetical protein